MSTSTLLFGATDLASLCTVEDLSDFWTGSDPRGDLPKFPGVNGAAATQRPADSKVCSGQVTTFTGNSLADTEDAVAAIKALLRVGQTQTITRRKVTGSGNLDTTQVAIARAPAERWLTPLACTLLLSIELTEGFWYGASRTIASGAGTQTIAGDAATSRMTITLAAGAARTVANSTNGYSFVFLATVPAGGVLVDVQARTATAITGGADMSNALVWSKGDLMRFEAGANMLATDASSFSVSYQPAYL